MWVGPLVITINANLLGSDMYVINDYSAIMQTLCLIIYCSTPVMVLSVVIFLMNTLIGSFLLNLIFSCGALAFIIQTNKGLFESFIPV